MSTIPQEELSETILSSLRPVRWPARIIMRFLKHTHDAQGDLSKWFVTGVLDSPGIIDVSMDRAIEWMASAAAKKSSEGAEPLAELGDGDYLSHLEATIKVGRRHIAVGELLAEGDGETAALVREFQALMDESEDEAEKEEGEQIAAAAEVEVKGDVSLQPVIDLDLVDDVDLWSSYLAPGSGPAAVGDGGAGGSSSSSSGGSGGVSTESLDETLKRLNLRNKTDAWPRGVMQADAEAEGGEVPIGKMYLVWGRTVKSVCKAHAKCNLMMNTKWFHKVEDAQRTSYEWLARARQTTEHQHYVEAHELLKLYRPK
jgi:hypothetical protein